MKSTGDAVTELLAGRVQAVTAATIGVTGYRNDPRVTFLAYTGKQRSRFAPDLPTVAESGLPGYAFDSWLGLLAPAGIAPAERDRLNAAVNSVLADPKVQARLAALGVEAEAKSPAQFQAFLTDDWAAAGQPAPAAAAAAADPPATPGPPRRPARPPPPRAPHRPGRRHPRPP
ncbi:tripartite tricarboxylate transporter substrate-binding protein, partial [Achromobacter ruhlandii]